MLKILLKTIFGDNQLLTTDITANSRVSLSSLISSTVLSCHHIPPQSLHRNPEVSYNFAKLYNCAKLAVLIKMSCCKLYYAYFFFVAAVYP